MKITINNEKQLATAIRSHAMAVLVMCGAISCFCSTACADDPDKELLEKHNIQCNVESLAKFFESLNPEGDVVSRTRSLLDKLGSNDFQSREEAMIALLRIPQLPLELVKESANNSDPEIQWRSTLVLKQAGNQSRQLLRSSLKVVAEKKLKGLAKSLMSCTDYYDDLSLQRLAQQALLETAVESDADLLHASTKHDDMHVRLLALRGLVKILGDDAQDAIRPHLDDPEDEIKLFAAYELAKRSDHASLQTFSDLLDSADVKVRSRCVQLLRAITGKNFTFTPYAPKKEREKATKSWRDWIDTNAKTVKFESTITLDPIRVGRILVCYYNKNLVVEYDEEHNEVWSTSVAQPWGCQGLPNGHRLIASYGSNAVIEYDEKGDEVWRASIPGKPVQAQRLDNGNTIVAVYSKREIIEITPDNETVGTVSVPGQPNYVQRTSEGHTLVACGTGGGGTGGVFEFDTKGEQLRKISSGRPFSAHRLSNGNTLIADSATNSVREIDPDDGEVWSKSGISNPLDAYRMDNGNTLITHQTGVMEVDEAGKTVWSDNRGYGIRVCYY